MTRTLTLVASDANSHLEKKNRQSTSANNNALLQADFYPEAIAAYLAETFQTNDPMFMMDAVGAVARARGFARLAHETGMLERDLSLDLGSLGEPRFATIILILAALGVSFAAVPRKPTPTSNDLGPSNSPNRKA